MSLAARLLALAAALLIMLPAGAATADPEPLPTPCGSGTALTPYFRVQLPHGPAVQVDPGHPGPAELLASSDGYLAYSGCVSPNSTTTLQIRDRDWALVETIMLPADASGEIRSSHRTDLSEYAPPGQTVPVSAWWTTTTATEVMLALIIVVCIAA